MEPAAPLLVSQWIVRVCLFAFAAIALFGGALQMVLGQPDTSPRLDNVHRFMAGIYFGMGAICLWAGITISSSSRSSLWPSSRCRMRGGW